MVAIFETFIMSALSFQCYGKFSVKKYYQTHAELLEKQQYPQLLTSFTS